MEMSMRTASRSARGLREMGWIEGENLLIEQTYADGHPERLPGLGRVANAVDDNALALVADRGVFCLALVPLNRICATPRASLGFHMAYYDKSRTFGVKITSLAGTADLMSYYPETVKEWIGRHGGLTTEMKKVKNGPELWTIVDPCPEEVF
jgi:hypothetical protein